MKSKLPLIGLRIVKSAIAVFFCYLMQSLRGDSGIVFYSQLSALWCIQSYVSTTKKNALQRTIGTVIGAIAGLIVLLICNYVKSSFTLTQSGIFVFNSVVIPVTLVVILYVTVLIKKKQASYFSCVVFLSIVVIHGEDSNPYFFAFNRFLDTMIGILIGVSVNLFHLPRKKRKDILYISGLDNTLLDKKYHLNDYCKVELNRMLDAGLNFTLSTMRTPASIIEPMSEIRLKLPVIAMDGAVLYDIVQKRYIKKIEIDRADKDSIVKILNENDISYFANVVIDDTLLIYYPFLDNDVQRELVKSLRISPYRNYINRCVPNEENVVYFMLLYPDDIIKEFYKKFNCAGLTAKVKILMYKSDDYPGFSYIKIFNKVAQKSYMIEYLKRLLGVDKTITFGTKSAIYDYVVPEGNTNLVVHTLKHLFEGW